MNNRFILGFLTVVLLFSACKKDTPSLEEEAYRRNAVLIEEFTGQGCGNCPIAAKYIKDAMHELGDKAILVAHHVGYYEDDFTLEASRPLISFYENPARSFAPAFMLNRKKIEGDAPVFSVPRMANKIVEQLKKQLMIESGVSIDINTTFDPSTKQLKVDVLGDLHKKLPNAHVVVYITQDKIMAKQAGFNSGDYPHSFVLRAVLSSNVFGDKIDVAEGKFTKSYTYDLPPSISGVKGVPFATDVDNMYVVAFVADFVSTDEMDINKNIVHDAIMKKIIQ